MPVHNADIAEVISELADLLEIQEANPFRVRAYRNAAQTVAGLPRDAADMLRDHEDRQSRRRISSPQFREWNKQRAVPSDNH